MQRVELRALLGCTCGCMLAWPWTVHARIYVNVQELFFTGMYGTPCMHAHRALCRAVRMRMLAAELGGTRVKRLRCIAIHEKRLPPPPPDTLQSAF